MKKYIADNPFRVLGIYSNSPQKEIVKNISRMNAYLNVGRDVSFNTDLNTFLDIPTRNADTVSAAQASINLPIDKVSHALFWFIKLDSIDEIGLNYLQEGDLNKALDIFNKRNTFSSLINRAVTSLLYNDIKDAANAYQILLNDYSLTNEFVSTICDDTVDITKEQLVNILVERLASETISCEDIERWRLMSYAKTHGKLQILPLTKSDTNEPYKVCGFTHPVTDKLTLVDFSPELGELSAQEIIDQKYELWVIETNKNDFLPSYYLIHTRSLPDGYCINELINAFSDPEIQRILRTKAAERPITRINSEIASAKSASKDDANASLAAGNNLIATTKHELQNLKEIVGEDNELYSLTADNLAKQILQCGINYFNNSDDEDSIQQALSLQEYAHSIAVGKLTRDRCKQNIDILVKRKAESAFEKDITAIINRVKSLQKAQPSVDTACQFIEFCKPHLQALKNGLGSTNETYIQISSGVANSALNMVIDALNKNSGSKSAATAAQNLINTLLSFDLDSATQSRLSSNASILARNIANMPNGFQKVDDALGGCLSGILGLILNLAMRIVFFLIIGGIIAGLAQMCS